MLLIGMMTATLAMSAALASTTVGYYLSGDGVPKASLSTTSPPGGALPNLDPGRNNDPGLQLNKTDKGMAETNPKKFQHWQIAASALEIDGSVTLMVWTAMKDFKDDKDGQFTAYLLDCSSTSCDVLGTSTNTLVPPPAWTPVTVTFPAIKHTIGTGRSLAVRIVVTNESDDDMWFAYATSTYPRAA